jgi:hypothetical protein
MTLGICSGEHFPLLGFLSGCVHFGLFFAIHDLFGTLLLMPDIIVFGFMKSALCFEAGIIRPIRTIVLAPMLC